MGNFWSKKRTTILCCSLLILTMGFVAGCSKGKEGDQKVSDLKYTVIGENEIPQELKKIVDEKKTNSFKLTYSNDQDLYIVVGYGQQKSGGYSITVPQLYLTSNTVVIKTQLMGPEKGENIGVDPSFPYIVVKTELRQEPVVFQ